MRFHFAWGLVPFVIVGLVRCVGDSSLPDSGIPDATQGDGSQGDASNDVASDASDAGPPAPTPDGSVVWVNHYNNNVYPVGNQAFSDLALNESTGLTLLVAGGFLTDPATGNRFNFGTIPLGPSSAVDPVAGGLSSTGSAVWAKAATVNGASAGSPNNYQAIATDSAGNVYVFGSTQGTSITLKNNIPGPTSFVAKLTATGTPLWDHAYSSNGSALASPVGITLTGSSLVVVASFYGSVTYDSGQSLTSHGSGDEDAFVTALDLSTGATQWAGAYGSPNNDDVSAVAATPAGDVVVTGTLSGTMTGLTGPGMPVNQLGDAGSGGNLYILRIDTSGHAVYNLVYGDPNASVYGGRIAYRNGIIAVAGGFYGTVDFGGGPFAATAEDGMVFTVNESTKKTVFATQLAGAATDFFTTTTIDAWGEVIAAGVYGDENAAAQLGALPLQQSSIQTAGMVLAKWSPTGTLLWAHGYVPTLSGGAPPYTSSSNLNIPLSIVPSHVQTTAAGGVVVTGTMAGGTDFGKGYAGQLSTFGYGRCTCGFSGKLNLCNSECIIINPPACCDTVTPGFSADGIVGVWQP